jgi:hypothetical protein
MASLQRCQPSPFLSVIYPQPAGSTARVTEWLHGEKVLQVRGSGVGANERQGRLREGASDFIPKPWPGCTVQLVGRDWRAWAVFLGGIVH